MVCLVCLLVSQVFKNFVGTAQFMAPETIKNQTAGRSTDLWSLGCAIYQILAGKSSRKDAWKRIRTDMYCRTKLVFRLFKVADDLVDLINTFGLKRIFTTEKT